MIIVAVGSAPFNVTDAILKYLEPDLVNGHRPLWWRLLGTALGFAVFLIAPVVVRYFAREIVRTDGWLGTRPTSPKEQHAIPSA